ncbi:MAG: hypothetical protein SFV52_08865 [Saprospiraceae bacterium]|nr:hypothetical protein [Saprospiraceae bacterium]
MNKNTLLAGALLLVGFIGLTAFGGKTREQQEAEITTAVTAKLDELRAQLEQQCTDRVMAEAQTRYDAFLLEQAGKPSKPGVSKPSTKPKPGTSGSNAKPLPEPQKPAQPADPAKDKWNTGDQNTGSKDKWNTGDKSQPANTGSKDKWNKSGGN